MEIIKILWFIVYCKHLIATLNVCFPFKSHITTFYITDTFSWSFLIRTDFCSARLFDLLSFFQNFLERPPHSAVQRKTKYKFATKITRFRFAKNGATRRLAWRNVGEGVQLPKDWRPDTLGPCFTKVRRSSGLCLILWIDLINLLGFDNF